MKLEAAIKGEEDGQADARHYRGGGSVHQPRQGPGAGPQVSDDIFKDVFCYHLFQSLKKRPQM